MLKNISVSQKLFEDGTANGVRDDTPVAHGRETNVTVRGEIEVERSVEPLERSGRPGTPTVTYRRRKVRAVETRPRSFISVVSKICLLLVGLLWMGQMIWKWSEMNSRNSDVPFNVVEYEGRISDVEASFKRITQMLQVQLEVVDKKIENEVGIVAGGLKQAEERGVVFEKELKELEARSTGMEKYLGDLKDMGLFTKEELESFWNELKKSRRVDVNGEGVSLDDVRAYAKEIVEKEIEKHAADGIGRVDYALGTAGARVVRHSEPYDFRKGKNWVAAPKILTGVHANAQKMLEPSFGEPGQCFALQGSSGFVEIRLKTAIVPEAVTLEHVSKSVAFDRSSAPKDCRISAWLEGAGDDPSSRSEKMFILTEFSYDLDKSNSQTFNVESANSGVINMVRFDFSSNHGSSSVTCIYRFRVHGYEPKRIQGMVFEA